MNYHLLKNSLVLNFNGRTVTLPSSDNRFPDIVAAIQNNELDKIPGIVDRETAAITAAGFTVEHGLARIDNETLPVELSNKLLQIVEMKLPVQPLVNFWRKLKKNPSFNSRKMLYAFLDHNGHPITSEGNFIAYRSVRSDFTDKHTGKMSNNIGETVRVPRWDVDDNPNNTCSFGLHVATHGYAKSFGSGSDKLLEVEVNPEDVVCVPVDYNGTKMRVCAFKVLRECEKMREEIVLLDDEDAEDDDSFEQELDDYYSSGWSMDDSELQND